jgi:hypothetical protein
MHLVWAGQLSRIKIEDDKQLPTLRFFILEAGYAMCFPIHQLLLC